MVRDKKKKRKTTASAGEVIRELLIFVLYLLIVIVVTFFVIHFIGQRTRVRGKSMEPTLFEGDQLIVDKVSYYFRSPKRFDIIVFPDKQDDEKHYIKRIIGLPGEEVMIDEEGYIYINGKELVESYGLEVIRNPGLVADGILLRADEYFVLGDNRNNSSDSRSENIGVVKRDEIIGRAWLRVYPFKRIGFIKTGEKADEEKTNTEMERYYGKENW